MLGGFAGGQAEYVRVLFADVGPLKIENGFGKRGKSMNESTKPFAVVTGASSGIGYELARQFAEHGYDLLICSDQAGIKDAEHALTELNVVV